MSAKPQRARVAVASIPRMASFPGSLRQGPTDKQEQREHGFSVWSVSKTAETYHQRKRTVGRHDGGFLLRRSSHLNAHDLREINVSGRQQSSRAYRHRHRLHGSRCWIGLDIRLGHLARVAEKRGLAKKKFQNLVQKIQK